MPFTITKPHLLTERDLRVVFPESASAPKKKLVNGKKWIAENQGKHFCHCGCGQAIKIQIHHHARGISKFIDGHVARVRNPMYGYYGSKNPNYNCGKLDNRIENLQLMTNSDHSSYHAQRGEVGFRLTKCKEATCHS